MQCCSSWHQILLSPPDTSTTESHFHFGPATSFSLELLVIALCSSPVAYWTPLTWGAHLLVSYLFVFSYCPRGSRSKNTGVVCHPLLQWTAFYQNAPSWPFHLGWPCMAWLIASLSYAGPFAMTRLWSMKGAFSLANFIPKSSQTLISVEPFAWALNLYIQLSIGSLFLLLLVFYMPQTSS